MKQVETKQTAVNWLKEAAAEIGQEQVNPHKPLYTAPVPKYKHGRPLTGRPPVRGFTGDAQTVVNEAVTMQARRSVGQCTPSRIKH